MTAAADEPHIGLVVEGRGEIQALPLLLRKWLYAQKNFREVLGRPLSCNGRTKALRPQGIEGFAAAAATRPGCRGVLVVLDGEDDPVCELGPTLAGRAAAFVSGKPVFVVLAESKFEAWLVASAESLELPGLVLPIEGDPAKAIREALHPEKYVKPVWQSRQADRLNLDLATSRSPRLKRLFRALRRLWVRYERRSGGPRARLLSNVRP